MSEIRPEPLRLGVSTPETRAAWDAKSPEEQSALFARLCALAVKAEALLAQYRERHRADWGHPPEREDPTTPPGWHTLENRR